MNYLKNKKLPGTQSLGMPRLLQNLPLATLVLMMKGQEVFSCLRLKHNHMEKQCSVESCPGEQAPAGP